MTNGYDQSNEGSSLIQGLEARLSSTFKPVIPDNDFVKRLKNRLAATPALWIEDDHSSTIWMGLFGVLLAVTGLLFLRWLWKYLFPDEPSG